MTRAVILAAGQGTRLRPLTNDKPKCLVELAGKSLLSRQIEVLDAAGITDIQIATSYREDQIRSLGYPTAHNPDYEHTNMVESLFSARPFLERSCTGSSIASSTRGFGPSCLPKSWTPTKTLRTLVGRRRRNLTDRPTIL